MRVFVVDDHPLMREAVVLLLRRIAPGAEILEFDRLTSLPQSGSHTANSEVPDLVCLDLKLPDAFGVTGVREVRTRYPDTPIVVLSASPAMELENACIEAGADIYLEKSSGAMQLSQALRVLLLPDSEARDLAPEMSKDQLSKRQIELLRMVDKGMSNRSMAEALGISEHTIKVHLWRTFRKLQVKNRSQAVHWARSNGMF